MARSIIAALFAAVVLASCNSGGHHVAPTTTVPNTVTVGADTAVFRGQAALPDVATLRIADNYFEPNVLTRASSATVRLTLTNDGAALHNFSLTAGTVSIDRDLRPGGTETVEFAVPSKGEFEFYCKYHKPESHMLGVIRVG